MKRLIERIRRPSAAARLARAMTTPLGSDIVSRLPIELHMLVLESLDVDDVRAGLAVCRTWRRVWLSPDVWPWLADRWAPGLAEHIRATTAGPGKVEGGEAGRGGEGEEEAAEAGERFRRGLVRARRRVTGRFAWTLPRHAMALDADRVFRLHRAVPVPDGGVHAYRQVPELADGAGRFPRFMFYCNGRVAWWPEAYGLPYLAVVDDLRSRRRRMYLYPGADAGSDRTGYVTALGDRLLLMGRGPKLHAWHLDDDRLATAPTLPAPIARTVVEGDTVLIVTDLGAVFLWTFGHDALRPVAAGAGGCYAPGPVFADRDALRPPIWRASRVGLRVRATDTAVDFALHPTDPGVFFVATLQGDRLVVHERAADGTRAASDPLAGPDGGGDDGQELLLPPRWLGGAGPLRWEKMDDHGGFCLLPVWAVLDDWAMSDAEAEALLAEGDLRPACKCSDGVIAVCFNVHTKAFSFLCYSFEWFQPLATACHVWNGRLHACARPGKGMPLVALRTCAERRARDGQALVPLYTTAPRRKKDPVGLARRHRQHTFPDTFGLRDTPRFRLLMQRSLEFSLDVEQAYAPSPEPRQVANPAQPDPMQFLYGDDDFLVQISGHEYTVWSFED